MKKLFYLIIILLLFICCGPKQEEVERISEDGVEVVINHLKPYKVKGEPSTLSLEELFIIDTEKEALAKVGLGEFAGIEVDSSGNIYFWTQDRTEKYIFKFDKDGNFLKSFGHQGQGPGELQFITSLYINHQDEITITDQRRTKFILLDLEGNLIEEKTISTYNSMVAPLSNDNYLASFYEYTPEAEFNHILMALYNSEFEKIKELFRIKRPNIRTTNSIDVALHGSIVDITQKNIFLGHSQKGYEIWVFDLEGNLVRKIRKEYEPVPVTEEYKENVMKRYENASEAIRNKLYFPKNQPPFQFGFVDDEGRIFMMTHERGEKPNEFKYDIFNLDGIFIGRTSLENFGQYGTSDAPLYAAATKGRLYCVRQKDSGFKELAVYKMKWE
jgi:hypothetical protein